MLQGRVLGACSILASFGPPSWLASFPSNLVRFRAMMPDATPAGSLRPLTLVDTSKWWL
jgi:hypothetical protein